MQRPIIKLASTSGKAVPKSDMEAENRSVHCTNDAVFTGAVFQPYPTAATDAPHTHFRRRRPRRPGTHPRGLDSADESSTG